jgi:uncharacterized protein with HEPN domain
MKRSYSLYINDILEAMNSINNFIDFQYNEYYLALTHTNSSFQPIDFHFANN